jgi:hypothetical protein
LQAPAAPGAFAKSKGGIEIQPADNSLLVNKLIEQERIFANFIMSSSKQFSCKTDFKQPRLFFNISIWKLFLIKGDHALKIKDLCPTGCEQQVRLKLDYIGTTYKPCDETISHLEKKKK